MRSPEAVVEADDVEAAETGAPTFSLWRLIALCAGLALIGVLWGWQLLVVILAVVAMLFLHELGHYVMAKRAGMKVTEFFLGFGPRIWSFRRGEVEYGIKAIPAGAYVRIIGMVSVDPVEPVDEARTYREKGFWPRIGVAVAGSTMHFLLALTLAFVALAGWGLSDTTTWVVDSPTPGSAAALAGIRGGDRVVSVAGKAVGDFDEMSKEVQAHPEQRVKVEVLRTGKRVSFTTLLGARAALIGTIGHDLDFSAYDGEVRINSVGDSKRHTIEYDAGLRNGDLITSINGVATPTLARLAKAAAASEDGKAVMEYRHANGKTGEATIDLGKDLGVTKRSGFLGVGQKAHVEPVSIVSAAGHTFSQFGQITAATVTGIGKVFNPANLVHFADRTVRGDSASQDSKPTPAKDSQAASSDRANLERPVSIIGIVGLGNQLSSIRAFLTFFAAVNITIGLINLIPLTPFDGGHVAVAVYEKIRELFRRDGRRYMVDATKLMPVTYAVLLIMVFVGVLAGYSDIVRPIQL